MSVRNSSVRNRFGTTAAIALVVGVGAVLVSACGPENGDSAPTAAPTGGAAPTGSTPGRRRRERPGTAPPPPPAAPRPAAARRSTAPRPPTT